MTKILKLIRKTLAQIRGRFPMALPIGVTAFDNFSAWLFETYDIPALDSYRETLATMIMHQKQNVPSVPPVFFARCIRKAQANEVAYHVIQGIKEAHKRAAQKLAEASKEATNVTQLSDAKPSA